jgi:phage I-like protein
MADDIIEQSPGEETPQTAPIRTFTQEELNRITGQRVAEERAKYGDVEALRLRAAKADELEQAQLTEKERLEVRLAEQQKTNLDALGRISSMAIQSDIKVRASQMGIIDPDAAVALIDRGSVAYSEESGVTGVEMALEALIVSKPYLKGVAAAPNLNAGNRQAAAPPIALTAEQREAAKLLNLPEDDYMKGLIQASS